MRIIFHWLVISAAIYGLAYFLPTISLNAWWIAFVVGAIMVFIDGIVKPIIKVLTLPINLITFGLFSIVLNVLFFWFPSTIISGFHIQTLMGAFIGAIAISIVNWIFFKVHTS